MQVRYDAVADRLLWQVRTTADELFAAWLTRRLTLQLWPLFQQLVAQTALPQPATDPTRLAGVMPEAREMLMQAARERPLPGADFRQPFVTQARAQPLGPEPMLPQAVDLGPGAGGLGLALALRDSGGRALRLQLSADMATALMRLLEQALRDADWGLAAPPATAAGPTAQAAPLLN